MNFCQKIRYTAARSRLRAPLTWMQHRGLEDADVFLAAFERSGSTWLRFALSEILSGQSAQFTNVNTNIPELFLHRQGKPVLCDQARLIKTHEPYRREYRRAVYLVRDVRNVLLSNYVREKAMGLTAYVCSDDSLDEYIGHFLSGKTGRYGSWQNHVKSWLNSPLASRGDMLVIRYEDLRADTESALRTILQFLKVDATTEKIREAISNNSLEKMRLKEDLVKADRVVSEKDVLLRFHRTPSEDARFVRSGSVAGWRGRLTDQQLELIDRQAGAALTRCGYPLAFKSSSNGREIDTLRTVPTAPNSLSS
jgi:sulfotransferase family protein